MSKFLTNIQPFCVKNEMPDGRKTEGYILLKMKSGEAN